MTDTPEMTVLDPTTPNPTDINRLPASRPDSAGSPGMRFTVDSWDPGFGTSTGDLDVDTSTANVALDVELPQDQWAAIAPTPAPLPESLIFVDGVRRVDAQLWLDDREPAGDGVVGVVPAICASYAAGAVCCCPDGAHVVQVLARRGLFTTATQAFPVNTSAGDYTLSTTSPDPSRAASQVLSQALQRKLAELELMAAVEARRSRDAICGPTTNDLLVLDGPLQGRSALERTLGYVKTHHSSYLPPELNAVVSKLSARERTPVFRVSSRFDNYTWYLRLPARPGSPWVGVVRVEATADLTTPQAITAANLSQAVLPTYAAEEYKDTRAPQNLYPIAGLERQLKRRLGDQRLLYRALRAAAV